METSELKRMCIRNVEKMKKEAISYKESINKQIDDYVEKTNNYTEFLKEEKEEDSYNERSEVENKEVKKEMSYYNYAAELYINMMSPLVNGKSNIFKLRS